MENTLEFPRLLRLIEERSVAFRAAVAAAPNLDVQVPTCPEWTLLDLVQHLGEVHRFWGAVVNAGPAADPPPEPEPAGAEAAPREREALLAWSDASTRQLLDALRAAGPDRGCWTWWATSQSPEVSGAVARHQVQEAAVHTYDVQVILGAPQPLPEEAALDGVEEFLFTCGTTTAAWPHEPAAIDFHAAEGRSWRTWLSADGARAARLPVPGAISDTSAAAGTAAAGASATGTASDLVLTFYQRIPVDSLAVEGDRRLFDLLMDWGPEE